MENRSPIPRSTIFVAILLACLLISAVPGPGKGHHQGAVLAGDAQPTPGQIIEIIVKATSAAQLEPYLVHSEPTVIRAAIIRLGELANAESVALLSRFFKAQPRKPGTGVRGGYMVDALQALATTRREDARMFIAGMIDQYVSSGPLVKGSYAHKYDPQYIEVLQAAISALGAFEGSDTVRRLAALSGNESLFYSVRETALAVLLQQQIQAKKLQGGARVEFLLTQMDAGGVFVETQWKAGRPGIKTLAASRQHVAEEMIILTGWSAAEPVRSYLAKEAAVERKVAAARILTALIGERLQNQAGSPAPDERLVVKDVLEALGHLPDKTLASPTVAAIYGNIRGAVDYLADPALWETARALQGRIKPPGSWEGAAPELAKMKLSFPGTAVFLADLSRRVPSQYGTLIEACYLLEAGADEVVAHFEKLTGIKARPVPGSDSGGKESAEHFIAHGQAPSEFAGIVEPGVRVVAYPDGIEVKSFGKVQARGRTMVIITAIER